MTEELSDGAAPPPAPPTAAGNAPGDRSEPLNIADELRDSYLTYAMSVIVSRALPDVRDGLKPSQRRILVAMNDLNLGPASSTSKCAGIVGETMKRYHPHGEATIYPTLVRMAQDWVMRHRMIHSQGNFGSIGGQPAAAMRYCVVGDARVRLADGTTPRIADLVPGAAPGSDTDIAITLLNKDGEPVTASRFFHSGDHPTFRLRTREGYSLTGTANHPVLCLEIAAGTPALHWRLLGEITPGMRVAVARHHRPRVGPRPSPADRQRAVLAGAVLSGRPVRPELARLAGDLDADAGVPEFVWTGGMPRKGLFLRSLFRGKVTFTTPFPRLARDVQALLLEFGIAARILPDGDSCRVRPAGRSDAWRLRHRILGVRNPVASRPTPEAGGPAPRPAGHYYAEVAAVEPVGVRPVYSVRVDSSCHSFVTDGVVSHNTEARLSAVAGEMLADLERDTVDFIDNYDGKYREPLVLPSRFPNLLVNGSDGIAVGMATEIPPHNLREVCDALIKLIDNPDLSFKELLETVPGPDFPTGGIICGRQGIVDGYRTGRGKITLRARAEIVEDRNRTQVVITEVPFQQNRKRLAEEIAALIKEERIQGVAAMRDESAARNGEPVRLVLDLKQKPPADPHMVLKQLYQFSSLQTTVSIILLALVDGRPQVLTLKRMMEEFLRHRVAVIRRRTEFLLREAKRRGHELEGRLIAVSSLDEIIAIIRSSPNRAEAKERLQNLEVAAAVLQKALGEAAFTALQRELGALPVYRMTEAQAEAVVRLQLGQLAALERDEIFREYSELRGFITQYEELLSSEQNVLQVVRGDLVELRDRYGDDRRTGFDDTVGEVNLLDLIPEETQAVTLSHNGYIKRLPLSTWRTQRRGGRGVQGGVRDEDFIEHFFVASTHAYLLCFTNQGQLYWLRVLNIPEATRTSAGRAIANVLSLRENEKISSIIPVRQFDHERHLLMATRRGLVKKTPLVDYSRPKQGGIIGIDLVDGDSLVDVVLTRPGDEVVLSTRNGMAIRFDESQARSMGRVARGVRGIDLGAGDELVGMVVTEPDALLLTVCEKGYGKRTPFGPNTAGDVAEEEETAEPATPEPAVADGSAGDEEAAPDRSSMRYRKQRRGGKGVRDIRTSERNGPVVDVLAVRDDDDIMLITSSGMVNRTRASEVRVTGRNTQGVRIINLRDNDKVVMVAKVAREDQPEGPAEDLATATTPEAPMPPATPPPEANGQA